MFTSKYDAIVENSVSKINVTAKAVDGKAVISGAGEHSLKEGSNDITIAVKAENGDVRNYVISVVRKPSSGGDNNGNNSGDNNVTTPDEKPSVNVTGINIDEQGKLITGISEATSPDKIKGAFSIKNGTIKVTDKNGTEKSGTVGTGDKVRIYTNNGSLFAEYSIMIYGDINGDGAITVKDALMVRKHILGMEGLGGVNAIAANVNRQNDGITVKDALMIRKHVLGMDKIIQ